MNIYDKLRVGLDISETRGKTIANNIANVNTSDYKRKYVSFEGVYDAKNVGEARDKIKVKEDTKSIERFDGSSVDIETEKVNQATNTLQYNGLIDLTKMRLMMISSVIKGR